MKEKKHLGCSSLTSEGGTVGRLKRPASANHTAAVRYCGLLDPGSVDLGGTRHGSPAQSNHNRRHENKLLRIAVLSVVWLPVQRFVGRCLILVQ